MQKVYIKNLGQTQIDISDSHDYIQTTDINAADIIVIITDKNTDTKTTDTVKKLVSDDLKHKIINILAEPVAPKTNLDSIVDEYSQKMELLHRLPTIEIPQIDIVPQKKKKNDYKFANIFLEKHQKIQYKHRNTILQQRTRHK